MRLLRFLALGDSYTIGESVPSDETWPSLLAARLTADGTLTDATIMATTGWTSGELLDALDAAPPHGPFDLVSVLIGVNDQYRGLSVDAFTANARGLLRRAAGLVGGAAGGVFSVSIPDWGVMPFAAGRDRARIAADVDRFNLAWKGVAVGAGVPFVDVTRISRACPGLVTDDGLHPSGAQYRQWTAAIHPVVLTLLNPIG